MKRQPHYIEPHPDERGVYFITSRNHVGLVKIGYGANIRTRIKQLQTSNPYPWRLLIWVSGGVRLERELHNHFAEIRVSLENEWFYAHRPLIHFIAEQRQRYFSGEPWTIEERARACSPVDWFRDQRHL